MSPTHTPRYAPQVLPIEGQTYGAASVTYGEDAASGALVAIATNGHTTVAVASRSFDGIGLAARMVIMGDDGGNRPERFGMATSWDHVGGETVAEIRDRALAEFRDVERAADARWVEDAATEEVADLDYGPERERAWAAAYVRMMRERGLADLIDLTDECQRCGAYIRLAEDGAWNDEAGACGCGDAEHEPTNY